MAAQGITGDDEPMDQGINTYAYRMTGGPKKLIIINNKKFDPKTKLPDRDGTSEDAKSLEDVFKKLGFDVVVHENQESGQMLKLMIEANKNTSSECECFAVAVLSYGNAKDNSICGVNEPISISSFVSPIQDCRTLAGKPKIFFFETFDESGDTGITQSDAYGETGNRYQKVVPKKADFLYVYSGAPGFHSSSSGSLFIQALTKTLKVPENSSLDILRILTRVSHDIAKEWVPVSSSQSQDLQKQVPNVISTLTKELYLIPKH